MRRTTAAEITVCIYRASEDDICSAPDSHTTSRGVASMDYLASNKVYWEKGYTTQ